MNDNDQTRQELSDAFKREFDRFCCSDARIKLYDRLTETLPFWSTLTDEHKEILITTNPQTLRTPLGWKFEDGKFVTESQKKSFLEEKKKLEGLVHQEFLNSIDLDFKKALEKYKTSFGKKIPESGDWVNKYFRRDDHLGQEEVAMENDKVTGKYSENAEIQEEITTPLDFQCNEFTVASCHNEELTLTLDNSRGVGRGNEKPTMSSEEIDNQPSTSPSPSSADLNQPEDIYSVRTPSPGISSPGPNESLEVQEDVSDCSFSASLLENSNRQGETNILMDSVCSPNSLTPGINLESQEDVSNDCLSSPSSSSPENSNQQENKNILTDSVSSPTSPTPGIREPGPNKSPRSPEDVSEDCSTSPLVPCVELPTLEQNYFSNCRGSIDKKNSIAPSLPSAILPDFDDSSSSSCTVPPLVDDCSDQRSKTLCPPSSSPIPSSPSPSTTSSILNTSNFPTSEVEPSTSSSNPPEVTPVKSPNRVASPQNENKRGRPRIQFEEPTTVRCEVDENLEEEDLDEIIIFSTKDQMFNSSVTLETDSTNSTQGSLESNCPVEDMSNDSDSVVDENLDDSDIEEIEISFSPNGGPRAVSNEDDSGVFDGISVEGGSMEDGPPDFAPSAVEISLDDHIELDVQLEDGDQTMNHYEPGNLDLLCYQCDVHENPLFPFATVENEGKVFNQKIDCFENVMSSDVYKTPSNCNGCCRYDSESATDFEEDATAALPTSAFLREQLSEIMASETETIFEDKSSEDPEKITSSRVHFHSRLNNSRIFRSSKIKLPTGFKFKQLDDTAQNIQTTPTGLSPSTPNEWHIESQAKDIRRFIQGLGTWNMDTLRAIEKGRKSKYWKLLKTVLNEDFDFSKYAKVYKKEMEIIPFLFLRNWENSQSEQLSEERSIMPIQMRQSLEKVRRQELDKIWTEQFTEYRTQYDLENFKISMSSNEFRSHDGPWEADQVAFVANFQGYIDLILRFHFPETSIQEINHLEEEFSKAEDNLKQNLKKELIENKWMPKISENEEKLMRRAYYRNWSSLEGFKVATMSVETCSAMIENYFDSQRNGTGELESFEVYLQNLLKRNLKLIKILPWVIKDPKPETSKRLQPPRAAKTWADKELPDITEYPPIKMIGNGVDYENSGGIPLFGGVLGGDKEQKKEENGREVSTFKFVLYPKNWVHDPNSKFHEIPLEGVLADIKNKKRKAPEVSEDKLPAKKKSRVVRKRAPPARKSQCRGRPRGRPTKKR